MRARIRRRIVRTSLAARPVARCVSALDHGEMRSVRIALLAGSLLLAGSAGRVDAGALAEPSVGCDRIVLHARTSVTDGSQTLLGAVSVPGRDELAAVAERTRDRSWPYYRSAGLAIQARSVSVSLEVPEGWRDRVAISWGGSPVSSSVRFAACPAAGGRPWNSYSGGFHLRFRGDCVPLHVRVGGRSTTVRLGIGRACGRDS